MTHSESISGNAEREEPFHRLHPLTLVLRAVVAIPALVLLLVPVFRSGDSSALLNLVLAIIYSAVLIPWLVLHYMRFRYRLTPNELIIHSGVLTRRRRNIPVDRIQTVEIERQLLQRLTGTARVRIHTAGSKEAEGALDVVSLSEARRIRETVRAYKGQSPIKERQIEPEAPTVFAMDTGRVLQSGVYRFSLLHIAIIFSFLQYLEPDPAVLASWFRRGWLGEVTRIASESPAAAAVLAIFLAVLLGWLLGIAVNFNRFYRYSLTIDKDRLYRRHGLLSVREGTIPLRRVQALILRTNPLMRHFGWYALDVQTMGTDVREQGHSIAIPFGRLDQVLGVADRIREGMPDARSHSWAYPPRLESVSRLSIRRALIRYSIGLAAIAGLVVLLSDLNGWMLLLLWPLTGVMAFVRWRCMGFDLHDHHLVVRRGVFRQHTWIIPTGRLQVLHTRSSFFQRRLGLSTVYVDTAGASPVHGSDIIDLDIDAAGQLAADVYREFSSITPRRRVPNDFGLRTARGTA